MPFLCNSAHTTKQSSARAASAARRPTVKPHNMPSNSDCRDLLGRARQSVRRIRFRPLTVGLSSREASSREASGDDDDAADGVEYAAYRRSTSADAAAATSEFIVLPILLRGQNSKLKTQNSKLKTQNSKLHKIILCFNFFVLWLPSVRNSILWFSFRSNVPLVFVRRFYHVREYLGQASTKK